jgi:ubiquinone/menaquinone biosynthesis C-methylase UbiE
MLPKPAHLGPEYAGQFSDPSVAAAYPHRPPYPADVFDRLVQLIPPGPKVVLDVGCGTGDLARPLAARVDRIDAVDVSAPMLELGRSQLGGDAPNLRWIHARVEEVPLRPPYALITAGESLHWLDWPVAMPRLARMLAPGGLLAIVERSEADSPWGDDLLALIRRYSTNQEFQPYYLVEELESRGLFQPFGRAAITPRPFVQSIESYVESIHSRNGFSRERMTPGDANAFDDAVGTLLARHTQDGRVTIHVGANVVWGIPTATQ